MTERTRYVPRRPGVSSAMKLTAPILALGGAGALATALLVPHPAAPQPLAAHTVATTSPAPNATVTVVGTGTVLGTPDQATMSFGVQVMSSSASGAYSGEASQAQKLIDALRAAGVRESDIQTEWVSLYPDQQNGTFSASSSVSAIIHGLAHAGSVIDAAVRATGDSIRLQGISLSIGDTSSLMAGARKAAVQNARARAQQYADAAGMRLGGVVSISESDGSPQPIRYGALPTAGQAQPIEAGQQTLEVSVTVVYALAQ